LLYPKSFFESFFIFLFKLVVILFVLPHELGLTQVGINVPISVPLPFSSFTSCKPSFAGDLNFDGNVYFFGNLAV